MSQIHRLCRTNCTAAILAGALFCLSLAMTEAYAVDFPVGSQTPKEYVMGVFPFLPPSNLEAIFAPITAELSQALNRPVRVRMTHSFDLFTNAIAEQKYDIVQMQPFDYVRVGKKSGYIPLVTRSEKLYASFSVKQDSPLKRLCDLRGAVVGLPPESAAVSSLAVSALKAEGLKAGRDYSLRYFSNHLSCLQQLMIGTVASCATSAPAVRLFEDQYKVSLRHIGKSYGIPHTMFAVHRRMPAAERAKIKATLLSTTLATVDPKLRSLFIERTPGDTSSGFFIPVSDRDYDSARKILRHLEQ